VLVRAAVPAVGERVFTVPVAFLLAPPTP